MTGWIAALLACSALAELFGTVTVWLNYSAGGPLASTILTDVAAERGARDALARQFAAAPVLLFSDPNYAALNAIEADGRPLELRSQVGHHLGRKWWVSAGLWAYVGGAITGLAAGYLALFR